MLQYNSLGNFDLQRFVQDLKRHAQTKANHLTMHNQIARETGLNKETVKFALLGNVSSFKTIVKLAGWAELWLDEYRVE